MLTFKLKSSLLKSNFSSKFILQILLLYVQSWYTASISLNSRAVQRPQRSDHPAINKGNTTVQPNIESATPRGPNRLGLQSWRQIRMVITDERGRISLLSTGSSPWPRAGGFQWHDLQITPLHGKPSRSRLLEKLSLTGFEQSERTYFFGSLCQSPLVSCEMPYIHTLISSREHLFLACIFAVEAIRRLPANQTKDVGKIRRGMGLVVSSVWLRRPGSSACQASRRTVLFG